MCSVQAKCCVCQESDSLLWRRKENGDIVCNSCYRKGSGKVPSISSARLQRQKERQSKRTGSISEKTRSRHLHQGKHTTTKIAKPFKSPSSRATIHSGDAVFYKGVRFSVGDVISLLGMDRRIYYGQLQGFLQDQYGQKMGSICWLLPCAANPTHFDPHNFILGPEDDTLWPLDCVEFVMSCPSVSKKGRDSSWMVNHDVRVSSTIVELKKPIAEATDSVDSP
eukprot:m.8270 g.8270  ORF g.8270 m.8270 type:complete len:223 (+) comp20463_c0_seq2:44-712(+)